MSDGVFISDRPQLAIARQTVSFASLGLNDPTLTRIIYEVGNPYLSYIPTDEFNPISGITEGKRYLIYLNAFFDGSPALANAVLDNLIPQTTTNVFADERTVFLCTSSVSFATAGITTLNTRLITLVSEGYFTSYDPNDTINGIDSFVEGELYDIDPITDIDLHLYGVTEIRYSDEVLYLDSLEDVVITNTNPSATLPLDIEEILVRNVTTGVWENQTYDPGVLASDLPDGLISGGKVIWEGGLTFRVTAAVYYIDGVRYESAEGTITLDTADATNPRFDLIVLNTSSAIVKLTGTPASDPSEPQVDPATQLYLTSILVGAAATDPTGVNTVIIYDENTEWTPSTSGTISVNFANTLNVSNGSKAAAVASWSTGANISFANSATLNVADVDSISMKIRLTTALSKNQNLSLQFYNGGTPASLQLPLAINKSIVGSYQAISLSGMSFTGPLFDRVKILFTGSTSALYIDEVKYQRGVAQAGTETDPTVPTKVKQIPVTTDASTNKYLHWDGVNSIYERKQIAYSEISGTPSIPAAYTDEQAQDAVGTILSSEFTYDDATPQISINQIAYSKITGTPTIPTQYTDEMAQDATAALLAAGTHTGITFTYTDASNKIDAVVTDTNIYNTDGTLAANRTITGNNKTLALTGGRWEEAKGADVASANNLTLGSDGNTFNITGSTQINAITIANWQAGSHIYLIFASNPTVKHNTAGGAGTAVLLLSGGVDYVAAANDVLSLVYDGTSWHEKGRKLAATGSGVNALAAIGATPNANGASISGSTLNLQPANGSFGGVVTTGTQSFAGAKTFSGSATRQVSGVTSSSSGSGLFGQSTGGGMGGEFSSFHSSTNTMREVVRVSRETSGTAAVGIGAGYSHYIEASDGNLYPTGISGRVLYNVGSTTIQSAIRHTVYNNSVEVIAEEIFASTVNTTNATPTNLISISITDETTGTIEVTIVGRESGTAGTFVSKKIFRYKKDGGTLTFGTASSVLPDEATGTIATATYANNISSNNLSIDVTGVAATSINWKVNVKIIST